MNNDYGKYLLNKIKIEKNKTKLKDLFLTLDIFMDNRGYFFESYKKSNLIC